MCGATASCEDEHAGHGGAGECADDVLTAAAAAAAAAAAGKRAQNSDEAASAGTRRDQRRFSDNFLQPRMLANSKRVSALSSTRHFFTHTDTPAALVQMHLGQQPLERRTKVQD